MEVPELKRQVAEVMETMETMETIPLLRQFAIPPGIEAESSPKPDELELEPEPDYAILNELPHVFFNGESWSYSGPRDPSQTEYDLQAKVYKILKYVTDSTPSYTAEDYIETVNNGITYMAFEGNWYPVGPA
jgi:hypothetical protein